MSTNVPLPGYRIAGTRRGDTMQAIALRELGDAARWYDLVAVNNLAPPFITDEPSLAGPRVLLAGTNIVIPAPAPAESGVAAQDRDVFGTDCALRDGFLAVNDRGGIALVSGATNLSQAIRHVIATEPGEMVFHADYGCQVWELRGARNDQIADALAGYFVKAALTRDPRISEAKATATVVGDALEVEVEAITTDGRRVAVRST